MIIRCGLSESKYLFQCFKIVQYCIKNVTFYKLQAIHWKTLHDDGVGEKRSPSLRDTDRDTLLTTILLQTSTTASPLPTRMLMMENTIQQCHQPQTTQQNKTLKDIILTPN